MQAMQNELSRRLPEQSTRNNKVPGKWDINTTKIGIYQRVMTMFITMIIMMFVAHSNSHPICLKQLLYKLYKCTNIATKDEVVAPTKVRLGIGGGQFGRGRGRREWVIEKWKSCQSLMSATERGHAGDNLNVVVLICNSITSRHVANNEQLGSSSSSQKPDGIYQLIRQALEAKRNNTLNTGKLCCWIESNWS